MAGQEVCRMHGGATKTARARAQERIAEASDPAAKKLVDLMRDKKVPYSVQLAAAKDLLDRAGIGTEQAVTIEVKKWEAEFESMLVDVEDPGELEATALVLQPVTERKALPRGRS
jgi:hypothetical protein